MELEELPNETILNILRFLEPVQRMAIRRTSKKINELVLDESYWKVIETVSLIDPIAKELIKAVYPPWKVWIWMFWKNIIDNNNSINIFSMNAMSSVAGFNSSCDGDLNTIFGSNNVVIGKCCTCIGSFNIIIDDFYVNYDNFQMHFKKGISYKDYQRDLKIMKNNDHRNVVVGKVYPVSLPEIIIKNT